MATFRSALPDLYLSRLVFLDDVLFDEFDLEDGIVSRVFKMRDMGNKPFVNTTTIASFGTVPIKAEGADVTYDEIAQGYNQQYLADTYELAFRTSKEALDDEQEEVVSDGARALGSSLTYAYNVDHANVFNRGFNSSYTGLDAVELFSTAHTLVGGGTVPHENQWLASELIDSPDRPDTANRAINAFKKQDGGGVSIIAWPYLTDPDAWFLLATPEKHQIRSYWRERPNTMHDWDFESSSMKVKVRARWKRGWSDWRGVYGSPGA